MVLLQGGVLLRPTQIVAPAIVVAPSLQQRTDLVDLLLHGLQLCTADASANRCPVEFDDLKDGVPLDATDLPDLIHEQQEGHSLEMQYPQEQLDVAPL